MKKIALGLGLVVVLALLWVGYLATAAGEFRTVTPVSPGRCLPVAGATGAEDLTIDRQREILLVAATDRRSLPASGSVAAGIFAYDLNRRGSRPVPIPDDLEGDFYPHGLSLFQDETRSTVFVVNHTALGDSVEVFDWDGLRLEHRESVNFDLLINPNDVVGVDHQRFYATNDHGGTSGFDRALEDYGRLRRANVVYWDGREGRLVADGLGYANGIAVSPDGLEIYVAETTAGQIQLYLRDQESGALEANTEIVLGTGVDNIEVDRNGMLWVGAHPKLLTFIRHSSDSSVLSPSQAIWVDPESNFDPPVRDVYVDLGEEISGSSVATVWGSRLFIGSVFEEHFLDCERDPDA